MDEIRAYYLIDNTIATSGQPIAEQFLKIAEAGYTVVINLALTTSTYALPNEREIVEAHGMTYVHIPVSWEEPQIEDVQKFFKVMQENSGQKIWVHCALNMRVSCFMYLYRSLILRLPDAEAMYPMSAIWTPTGAWEELISKMKNMRT